MIRQPLPLGSLLQRYRARAGLTQKELAVRAQLSPDTIAALERGRRRTPREGTVHLLAAALDLTDAERKALLMAMAVAARPPRSTSAQDGWAAAGALPAALPTPLIDRVGELATIHQRLDADGATGARLLTLTGPAGVGKTRLALAAAALLADRFSDGVVRVDLTAIRDPPLVLSAIAHALGLADTSSRPVLDRLVAFLRERTLLLVLDNFEQVLPAAAPLADLLASCPRLTLLVTSRVPLRLRWEWTLRVPPLPVPDLGAALPPPDELGQIPSVALFVERAQAHQADFALTVEQAPLVAQLVVQMDGLPLALELAAARLDALSLPTIVLRLEDRLRLLRWNAPDLPERQRSLEAAIGWSYELLSAGAQRVFRSLGVFVGRVTLDALTAVVAGKRDERLILDELVSFVEQSLVLPGRQDDLEPAFSMLETVREYAWEQLAAQGELAAARRAHAHYFLALAERADLQLRRRGQRAWFARLEREHDNLRAALRWLLDQNDRAEREAALRLAGALGYFWRLRGYQLEGVRWLEEALRHAPEVEEAVRTRALLGAGVLLAEQGELDRAKALLDVALAEARGRQDAAALAQALIQLGYRAVMAGEWVESTRVLQEALRRCQESGDSHAIAFTLLWLSQAAFAQGHVAESLSLVSDALARFEALGDTRLAGPIHFGLGVFFGTRGDLPAAEYHVRAGLEASVALQDRWLLGAGARAVLALLGERANPAQRARLLGVADALGQAASATLLWERLPTYPSMAGLRERLEREGWGTEYREGRLLPFGAAATLALTQLQGFAQTLTPAELQGAIAQPAPEWQAGRASPLSEREEEVLRLVAQGLSNKAIARQLFISASTVNYHLTSVFHKLAVDTRAQAVAVAGRRGLLY